MCDEDELNLIGTIMTIRAGHSADMRLALDTTCLVVYYLLALESKVVVFDAMQTNSALAINFFSIAELDPFYFI